MTNDQYPKLRAIAPHPVVRGDGPALLLRDPLQLADKTVIIPQHLAPLLALCDGTRDASGLRASLEVRHGVRIGPDVLEQLLAALDEALLLDNDRFAQASERAYAEYREASFRQPIGAGQSYPADAGELRRLLDDYLEDTPHGHHQLDGGRGLVSPHIDYARGGPVYAAVWKHATEIAKGADLVVLLGTDHFGDAGLVTLTYQHYATPYGILPTAQEIVDALAQAIGTDEAFAGELSHRTEHAIELAAVWLHHVRGEEPCELVPILCGSFGHLVAGDSQPEAQPAIKELVSILIGVAAERRLLVVAAADLSHVGPAFGGIPHGLVERARLQTADDELIERICAGDAAGFFAAIKREKDRRNVCGLPPIYTALQLLKPTQGALVAYDRCPADQNGTSLVSICGIVFA